MNKYRLLEVKDKKGVKAFLEMPMNIYSDDPNWVRPWDHDIEAVFSESKNKLFEGGEAIRWVAYNEKGESVGRIAAFYNKNMAERSDVMAGGCGFYESIDDKELSIMLFDTAREWLTAKGMKAMDGPINFGTRDYFWGLLVDGFYPPMYNMNYNKPYYEEHFESYGFQNYFNQYSYYKDISGDGNLSEIVEKKAQRLDEMAEFEFRHITKKDYPFIAENFRTIYNKAWSKFTGVVPMTKEQADNTFKELKPIIDNRLIYFAFHNNEAIGFFIMVPNINDAIKPLNGKFNLWAKLKFIYNLKIKKSCKVINALVFAVIPEFQGKGIESGIINTVKNTLSDSTDYTHMELVWIGDFNPLMMRMVEGYVQAVKYKRHVTYRFMIDKTIEFKRCPRVSIGRQTKTE